MEVKSLSNTFRRFGSEAGSEQSTNFRWWDSRTRSVPACRLDLNHPPTSVGGIPEFLQKSLSLVRFVTSSSEDHLIMSDLNNACVLTQPHPLKIFVAFPARILSLSASEIWSDAMLCFISSRLPIWCG